MATKALLPFTILALLASSQLVTVGGSRQVPPGELMVNTFSPQVATDVQGSTTDGKVPIPAHGITSSSQVTTDAEVSVANGNVGELGHVTEEKAILFAPDPTFRPPRLTPCKSRAC